MVEVGREAPWTLATWHACSMKLCSDFISCSSRKRSLHGSVRIWSMPRPAYSAWSSRQKCTQYGSSRNERAWGPGRRRGPSGPTAFGGAVKWKERSTIARSASAPKVGRRGTRSPAQHRSPGSWGRQSGPLSADTSCALAGDPLRVRSRRTYGWAPFLTLPVYCSANQREAANHGDRRHPSSDQRLPGDGLALLMSVDEDRQRRRRRATSRRGPLRTLAEVAEAGNAATFRMMLLILTVNLPLVLAGLSPRAAWPLPW